VIDNWLLSHVIIIIISRNSNGIQYINGEHLSSPSPFPSLPSRHCASLPPLLDFYSQPFPVGWEREMASSGGSALPTPSLHAPQYIREASSN